MESRHLALALEPESTASPDVETVPGDRQGVADVLAVVGSREIRTADEHARARTLISYAYGLWRPKRVISGGARGIDKLSIHVARQLQIPTRELPPPPGARTFEDFRPRDERIARECTHLMCIRTVWSTTYGSGWTRDFARDRPRKPTWSIMLPFDGTLQWWWGWDGSQRMGT